MIFLLAIDTEEEKRKFEILYYQYRRLMFKIANDILNNYSDVEDVLHDTFEKVAKNMKHIGDPYSKETRNFIAVITKNTAIDMYRKKKRIWEREVEEKELDTEQGVQVYMKYEVDGEAQIFMEAIMKLPDTYKVVLSLKYTNQYSIKEISKILNISENNVKQRIFRAKRMLEDEIKKLSD